MFSMFDVVVVYYDNTTRTLSLCSEADVVRYFKQMLKFEDIAVIRIRDSLRNNEFIVTSDIRSDD